MVYNLNLKIKKEKKQSNFTNPDPWARIVGSQYTAAISKDGKVTTAPYDSGAELQLISKDFCEDNIEIHPIEKLTDCTTMNGSLLGYDEYVEVNVQILVEISLRTICFWLLLKLVIRRKSQF